jgi:hypothetical protein
MSCAFKLSMSFHEEFPTDDGTRGCGSWVYQPEPLCDDPARFNDLRLDDSVRELLGNQPG